MNEMLNYKKRGRTVTYQRSFFIRACRTWNVLPAELRTSHTSLASYKYSLVQYYFKVLDLYDTDDIRPGEQSVLGARLRGLYCVRGRAASNNLNFCFLDCTLVRQS